MVSDASCCVCWWSTFINWCSDQPDYSAQVQRDACERMKRDMPRPNARDDCLQREQLEL